MNKGLLCALLLSATICFSQRKDFSPLIPSPNAISLGEYGEIPVSFFTGVSDISIPLYELKGNKISVPISLSYHGAGLRPNVHPGWVGNGWSLFAGGVITRTPKGPSDERYSSDVGKVGFFYNYSDLNNSTWSSTTTLQTNPYAYPFIYTPPFGQVSEPDVEPDEFNFNFLGYSGKFFLDQTGQWQVQCDKPLKVSFNSSDFIDPFTMHVNGLVVANQSITKTFAKFTITDERGNKYIFGNDVTDTYNTTIEFSDVMIPQSGFRGASIFATSWYLSKIISADGSETVDFTYERGPMTSYIDFAYNGFAVDASGGGFLSMDPPCKYSGSSWGFNGRVTMPVYLKTISFPSKGIKLDFASKSKSDELTYKYNGTTDGAYAKVYTDAGYDFGVTGAPSDFPSLYLDITASNIIPYYGTNAVPTNRWDRFIWLKLDALYVRKITDNSIIKEFDFIYNNDANKRLQLNSLTARDNNTTATQKYDFTYNATSLPAYMTVYGDHWGFNNYMANNSNATLLGGPAGPTDYFPSHQVDPTGAQTQAEILTTIKYPTGGTTTFTYEPNKYSQVIDRGSGDGVTPYDENGVAGGLRIKRIDINDNFGHTITKYYYYVNGYTYNSNPDNLTSSGVLDSKPKYIFNCSGKDNSGYNIYYQSYSSNPVVPLTTNSTGTHIGYTNVVEKLSDGSYTVYTFSNQLKDDTRFRDLPPLNTYNKWALGYSPGISMAYKRGKLLAKVEYDNNGNLITEETNSYDNVGSTNLVNCVFTNAFNTCSGTYRGVVSRIAYQNYLNSFFPVSKLVKVYSKNASNAALTTTTMYSYNQNRQLIQTVTTDSKGLSRATKYSYANDFTTSATENPYNMLVSANRLSEVVEKQEFISQGYNTYVTSAQLYPYKSYGDNKIYNDEYYELDLPNNATVSDKSYTSYGDGGNLSFDSRYILKGQFSFDANGNISTISPKDNAPIAYLWNYNKTLPVAKVFNANNIYESGLSNNITIPLSVTKYLSGTKYVNYEYPIEVGPTGTVSFTFSYSNPYVSGDNSSNLVVNLNGVTNPSFTAGAMLCAKSNFSNATCYYGNSYTVTNVPPGKYTVKATVVTVVGMDPNYYGYNLLINYPIYRDKVVSANSNIAYTSFETDDYGNWTGVISGNISSSTFTPTGSKIYQLNSGQPISKTVTSGSYLVSYWSNTGAYSISGSQSVKTGRSLNGWTYYEHIVTGISTVSVSGSGGIDELRLYPSNALMTTYTYDPLLGMTSECDENNKIVYYQYDSFGRLSVVRDQENNIIKKICYNYAGMPTNCN